MLNHVETDRVGERGRKRETDRQKNIKRSRGRGRLKDRSIKDRQTDKKKDLTDKQRQKDRQTNKEGARQRRVKDRDEQRNKRG